MREQLIEIAYYLIEHLQTSQPLLIETVLSIKALCVVRVGLCWLLVFMKIDSKDLALLIVASLY